MTGIVVNPKNKTVHWLNTAGDASICGAIQAFGPARKPWFGEQLDGDGVAREVNCTQCWERLRLRDLRRKRRRDRRAYSPLTGR